MTTTQEATHCIRTLASEPPETYVEAGLARIRELKAERDQFALDRDEARAAIRDRVAQIDLQKAAPEALNEQERNDLAGLAFAAERQHAAVEAIDVRLRPFEDSC
jgi:hypothetical protein